MPACKSKTKFLPATFAWLLLLGTTTLFFYFPWVSRDDHRNISWLPFFYSCVKWYILIKQWYAVPIFQGIVTLFVLINFSMATFMDPGVIPRASPDEDRDDDFRAPLYRNVEINGITVRVQFASISIKTYAYFVLSGPDEMVRDLSVLPTSKVQPLQCV